MEYEKKEQIYGYVLEGKGRAALLGILQTMGIEEEIYRALAEVLLAED